jgi:4-amino-4-deoxy-L-arabinose transferase-like glycosyltransferase
VKPESFSRGKAPELSLVVPAHREGADHGVLHEHVWESLRGFSLADRRCWLASVAAVLCVSALLGSAGAVWVPAEANEAFVLETAQEMRDRGEWIVPYYNGEPRLAKPPLSYWLTRLVATAAGSSSRIEPWHGRVPSIASAVGMVAIALFLGARLFDRKTALVAAALTATSVGFGGGSHDGRTDMLYAFLCWLGAACFVGAWTARRAGRAGWPWSYAMWASLGLAVLAKGPHVPAMFLAALAIFCAVRGGGWRASLALLRPAGGLAIAALISVPWWVALADRVGWTALGSSQLAGTLLALDWRHAASPYYLYRALVFVLPWALLLPAALRLVWRRELRSDAVVLLALLYAVPIAALSLGDQRRMIYALPAWAPLMVLLGAGIVRLLRDPPNGPGARLWIAAAAIQLTAALGWFAWIAWSPGTTAIGHGLAGGGLAASAVFVAGLGSARVRHHPWLLLAALVGMSGLALAAGVESLVVFRPDRFADVRLAKAAGVAAGERTPIVLLGVGDSPYVYYTGARIGRVATPEQLGRRLAGSQTGEVIVLASTDLIGALPAMLGCEVLDAFADARDAGSSLLRCVRAKP